MFKHSLRTRLLIFILLVSIIPLAFLGYSGYANNKKLIIEKEEEKINFFFNNLKGKMIKFFNLANRDILFLKESTEDATSYSDDDISDRRKKELENIFYHFSKNNVQYDEIRFINAKGYEIIRINNHIGKTYKVPDEELQYNGNTDYFKEALTLKSGEILTFDIDLNNEKGQVEESLKPGIRYVTPIYSNNNLRGYLILNLNIQYLSRDIEMVKSAIKYDDMMILDSNGYYLFHPNKEKEWGGQNGLNTGENFKKDYPELYDDIMSSNTQNIRSNGEKMLAWYPVEFASLNNRKIIMFVELDRNDYLQPLTNFRNLFMIQIIITIFALVAGVVMISIYLTKPILKIVKAVERIGKGNFDIELDISTGDELELLGYEIKKMSYELKDTYKNMEELVDERTKELQQAHRELEEMATKDSLTGLYNRHYFNQYIQNVANEIENNYRNMMILIIDVDKFKYINDNYGHNIGDIVLKNVAKILKNSARESDIAVRYGGDEFLVALCDSKKELAEKYIERVKEHLDKWNKESGILKHELTLSIGYDDYSGDKHILEAINNADKMMYENKMAKRKKEQEQ